MASKYQVARRYAFWRGFAIAIAVFTSWAYLGSFAGSITG